MIKQRREEAIKYIESQLGYGYIDLGINEQDELEIVKEAINVLKTVDKFNSIGCTSFRLTSEEIKEILEGQENEMEQTWRRRS